MKNPFRLPSPAKSAADELHHAELGLLDAQSAAELATAMLGYYQTRVARLRATVDGADAPSIVKLPVMDPANFRRSL